MYASGPGHRFSLFIASVFIQSTEIYGELSCCLAITLRLTHHSIFTNPFHCSCEKSKIFRLNESWIAWCMVMN